MTTIAVVGLGYVGLPLAVEFGKKYRTIGFDLSAEKIEAYKRHVDPTGEVSSAELKAAVHLKPTTDPAALTDADFIVVAVPTPVDDAHIPDFAPLVGASTSVGKNLKKGAIVVYESTVYPGATEEICIPVLEKHSGLKWKQDFFVGYSPERINPGDKRAHADEDHQGGVGRHAGDAGERGRGLRQRDHRRRAPRLEHQGRRGRQGDREHAARPQHRADERAGDDLRRIGIDTLEVLEAAGTKWNFLPFRPGLVGGHCIGVDPYYLTHKAEMLGYHPQVILAGPPHQRRHGQVRRRADRQADDPGGLSGEGRARQRARPDVQGELPGPAQLAR